MMLFFIVEKYLKGDREQILERQKAEALAAGIEWIEPEVRLAREQAEAERLSEEARKLELKARCEKKGPRAYLRRDLLQSALRSRRENTRRYR